MKKILTVAAIFFTYISFAQDSTIAKQTTSPLTFSGYVEGYYSYDFNKPANNTKPGFIYNHNRHNEFNVNLAFIRGSYTGEKIRGTLALAAGTYMNANYSAEPGTLKNIFEANAGFKIGKKNLWLDLGILPSHIGFESAVSKDCWTLTRSILAENSPYFEAGARLSYTSDDSKWLLAGLLLNGYQRITRVDGNSKMSYGAQIQYKPASSVTLNYSNFYGTDKPDSARLNRFYNNFYGIFQVTKQFGIIAGFDFCQEQKAKGSSSHNNISSPVIIAKYSFTDKLALAARGEYYSDRNEIFIPIAIGTGTRNGFKTYGYSLNIDYAPAGNMLFRVEGKTYHSKDNIFIKNNGVSSNDPSVTFSTAISF